MSGIRGNTVFAAFIGFVMFPLSAGAIPVLPQEHTPAPRIVPERPAPPPPVTLPSQPDKSTQPPAHKSEDPAEDIPSEKEAHPPAPKPEILSDIAALPEPVRQMRQRIIDAAISGDTEKLRPLIKSSPKPPVFTFTDQSAAPDEQEDPLVALRKASYDGEGREILAILAEVMEARFVLVDKGTPQEMYVWPYFAQYPIDQLSPQQIVELFRIVTAFEFNEMTEFGAYTFYRVGISPDGTWQFMVTGD